MAAANTTNSATISNTSACHHHGDCWRVTSVSHPLT